MNAASLKGLIEKVLSGVIRVDAFCEEFERIYNFELDTASLSQEERQVFSMLFDKVVYYSPFPEERTKISNYLGEDEILESARLAYNRLSY